MHLLAAQPGGIADAGEAVDLAQSPGDVVFLSAADSELACLAVAQARQPSGAPSLRLANLMNLSHNLSVDLYVDSIVRHARLVVVRLLGGVGYWSYGVERLVQCARDHDIALALLPGDDRPDPELDALATLPRQAAFRLWHYCLHGGIGNAGNLLRYAATLVGGDSEWHEPAPLLRAGLYWPDKDTVGRNELRANWRADQPVAALVFYRALLQAANLAPVDDLIAALAARGLNPLPIYVTSLKDELAAETLRRLLADDPPSLLLNCTAFAVSRPGAARSETPFDAADCPVLQVVFSGGTEAAWRDGQNGLSARDIAMNVALPEIDGRLLTRAVSFKAEARYDALSEVSLVRYASVPDRIAFVADQAVNWARLRDTPAKDRRIAVVLANYPNRDGRIGNGVGLDTPASVARALHTLAAGGYRVVAAPADGNALIDRLLEGPTNDPHRAADGVDAEFLALPDYERFFAALPATIRDVVTTRWGPPERDPFFHAGSLDCGGFRLPLRRFGNVVVGIQPARGYNIDPKSSYHDPDLPPPHGYLAFYAWLREQFGAHAVIHFGKHGNLEWLPGKALALSAECFPEAAMGPLPHIYPFIVNDPGEGSQAKRRTSAVIVDHLTPPLTRAESYGPLKELEVLVDEYYEAAGLDPRRLGVLREQILDMAAQCKLAGDAGIAVADEPDNALKKLDAYLCELKEMQIRDGLHIFGQATPAAQLPDLLVSLVRVPRGGNEGDASLIRALAADLSLGDFDPLDCPMAETWAGPKPAVLANGAAWRSNGDTVERLEGLARSLVTGEHVCGSDWPRTTAVLAQLAAQIRPAVEGSAAAEVGGLLCALDGRFVAPGPSGAPSRGRPEVLPTGRNFYSVDTRAVPTAAAWLLGWKSATLLLERYRQENGDWPKALALSAWGTANMRTGGDDIAQALALIGVRPRWETGSGRVAGFEILPLDILDRPRVDVTLRISGFFRDAFPAQIDLFDSAVRAVAALDEPAAMNPLAARVARDARALRADGLDEAAADRRAGHRVFGSKPGAYGAGLQALIDERGWDDVDDLARAYIAWGGYAYGVGVPGAPEHRLFERRLSDVQLVLHNQDNREHDLLDSDDYYQFEGGLAAAVKTLSGAPPAVYHNDHSRPESPKIRSLEEEIGRVVRARAVNPKWIAGVMRHGYKGASEIAATVDYLFAFAATTGSVADHHFDLVFDAYLGDEAVRRFLLQNNPAAAAEIAARLGEAQDRGLWRPRRNTVRPLLDELMTAQREERA